MASTNQVLQCLLDPQQWIRIFLHVGIEMVEIYKKSVGPCPSLKPTPPHYTIHSSWGELHLNPTSLTGMYRLHPPTVGEST